ncbi:mannosyl-oligosaccharide alpha-1,2-mannosidase [Exophiala xenobiotica]|nr:mannosyl-oligosaccharide alpha-1,2-mannosidase [Exophiala xenobiotica]
MDHLVCFMPGTIALAVTEGQTVEQAKSRLGSQWTKKHEENLKLAEELMKTLLGNIPIGLRLSLMHCQIMITKDPKYRQWGWEMFEACREHTKVVDEVAGKVYAYTSLDTVMENPVKDRKRRDNMESFWLAETLKYFYLLFSDDSFFPLDSVVFNTEAHPLPKFDSSGSKVFVTGWQRNTGKPAKPKPGSNGKVVRVDAPQKVEKVAAADAQKPAVAVPHEHGHDDTMEHGHIEESGKISRMMSTRRLSITRRIWPTWLMGRCWREKSHGHRAHARLKHVAMADRDERWTYPEFKVVFWLRLI